MKKRESKVLSGIWDFRYFKEKPVLETAVCNETMVVPGCFDSTVKNAGLRGFGLYRKKVIAGGKQKLYIDGAGVSAEIFWDNKLIGVMQYAYMPYEFEFDAGIHGNHELSILVDSHYNYDFELYFDFFAWGGIYGDVVLESLPEKAIGLVRITTADYKTGQIRVRAELPAGVKNFMLVFDNLKTVDCKSECENVDMLFHVPNFKLWSDLEPHLHSLVFATEDDSVEVTFGIREIRTEKRKLLLNGKELKLAGFCRHESHPTFGAATPETLMLFDLELIKSCGANFIRGTHYPQRKKFLDLCDRMGILVWEETLGWDVKPPKLHSDEFKIHQLEEVALIGRFSVNHPSVIIRGFLNENESQYPETLPLIQALTDAFHALEDGTLVTYASNKYENDCCLAPVDIVAMNPYPGWYDMENPHPRDEANVKPRLSAIADAMPKDKPFLISELGAAAMIGFRDWSRTRWTEDYQADVLREACEFALEDDRCCGIAIWQFCDSKSYNYGNGIFGRPKGNNNKGVLDDYRRPKVSWDMLKTMLGKIVKKDRLKY